MDIELEDDDKVFEAALADRRHKELVNSLKGVIAAVSSTQDNSIKQSIENQTKTIERFIEVLNNVNKNEKSEVKVDVNQDKVVNSVDYMTTAILQGLTELKQGLKTPEVKKEWKFEIVRNKWSELIESVTAKQI